MVLEYYGVEGLWFKSYLEHGNSCSSSKWVPEVGVVKAVKGEEMGNTIHMLCNRNSGHLTSTASMIFWLSLYLPVMFEITRLLQSIL